MGACTLGVRDEGGTGGVVLIGGVHSAGGRCMCRCRWIILCLRGAV